MGPRDRVTSTSATIRPGSRSRAGRRFLGTLSLWGTDNDDLLTFRTTSGTASPSRRRMPVTSAAGRRRVLDDRGDLNDADRLYASVLGDGRPRDDADDERRAGLGARRGPLDADERGNVFRDPVADPGDGVHVIPQPLMVTFDPDDADIIVASGRQSGVFISTTAGTTGRPSPTRTRPPRRRGSPTCSRPLAHFDHDKPGVVRLHRHRPGCIRR